MSNRKITCCLKKQFGELRLVTFLDIIWLLQKRGGNILPFVKCVCELLKVNENADTAVDLKMKCKFSQNANKATSNSSV